MEENTTKSEFQIKSAIHTIKSKWSWAKYMSSWKKYFQSTNEYDFKEEVIDKHYCNYNANYGNEVKLFQEDLHYTEPASGLQRHKDNLQDKQLESETNKHLTLEASLHKYPRDELTKEIEQSNTLTVSHTLCSVNTLTTNIKNPKRDSVESTNDSKNTYISDVVNKVEYGLEDLDCSADKETNERTCSKGSRLPSDVRTKAKVADFKDGDLDSELSVMTHNEKLKSGGSEKSGEGESIDDHFEESRVDELKGKNRDISVFSWECGKMTCRRSERIQGRDGMVKSPNEGSESKTEAVISPCQKLPESKMEYNKDIQCKKSGAKRQLVKDKTSDILRRKKCKEKRGNSPKNSPEDLNENIMDIDDDDDLPDLTVCQAVKGRVAIQVYL